MVVPGLSTGTDPSVNSHLPLSVFKNVGLVFVSLLLSQEMIVSWGELGSSFVLLSVSAILRKQTTAI